MKTSTLIASFAVVTGFATLTVTNMRLKSEYEKGNLKDPYVRTSIAPFRFIKEEADTSLLRSGSFTIMAGLSDSSSIASYFSDEKQFIFEVKNDTLYIRSDPSYRAVFSQGSNVVIRTKQLDGLEIKTGRFDMEAQSLDALTVALSRKAMFSLRAKSVNRLAIHASQQANTEVSVADTIQQLDLRLDQKSRFAANNLVALQKNLQLSGQSQMQLSGRSIGNFGVK